MARIYTRQTIELLWGRAAARCAYPDCRIPLTRDATESDGSVVLGIIAHIEAHSDDGPRANVNLSERERNGYENLILLCAHHHALVDKQTNTFPSQMLRDWKTKHEEWVTERLTNTEVLVPFSELDIVTKVILSNPIAPSDRYTPTPPQKKMEKNELTQNVLNLVYVGLTRFKSVERFVEKMSLLDPQFPQRLIGGFNDNYNELVSFGLKGDALFLALHKFSSQGSHDFERQGAGLAVLTYLFQKCDIFDP